MRVRGALCAHHRPAEIGLPIEITPDSAYPAQPFHADCVDAVGRAAAKLGYSPMPVVSRPGRHLLAGAAGCGAGGAGRAIDCTTARLAAGSS